MLPAPDFAAGGQAPQRTQGRRPPAPTKKLNGRPWYIWNDDDAGGSSISSGNDGTANLQSVVPTAGTAPPIAQLLPPVSPTSAHGDGAEPASELPPEPLSAPAPAPGPTPALARAHSAALDRSTALEKVPASHGSAAVAPRRPLAS